MPLSLSPNSAFTGKCTLVLNIGPILQNATLMNRLLLHNLTTKANQTMAFGERAWLACPQIFKVSRNWPNVSKYTHAFVSYVSYGRWCVGPGRCAWNCDYLMNCWNILINTVNPTVWLYIILVFNRQCLWVLLLQLMNLCVVMMMCCV